MKQYRYGLVAWSARVLCWLVLVVSGSYILSNREGIRIRGQFARMAMEESGAYAELLEQAELPLHFYLTNYEPMLLFVAYEPFWPLRRQAVCLTLHTTTDLSSVYVVFDRDGRLAGAPVEFEVPSSTSTWGGQVVDGIKPGLVLVIPYRFQSMWRFGFKVFRLDNAESSPVLALECDPPPRHFPTLEGFVGVDGESALRLRCWITTAGQAPRWETWAEFVWNNVDQRFIELSPDPQGRWRIIRNGESEGESEGTPAGR